MKNKTLQIIRKYDLIRKNAHIIIGLSGGPDSVCLFDILFNIAEENPELSWTLHAVHINHKLREGAAEEDQKYVEELCAKRHVSCRVVTADCKAMAREMGISSEEAGRKARYDAFSAEALSIAEGKSGEPVPEGNIVIALAHNANDQCETILFRLMRGSGVDGLAGMSHKRLDQNGFAVVRPILDFSRGEIERYCRQRNLEPRTDHTNSENIYTRNKIRNLLIPYMEENFNENITETVNRLGKIASCDRDFLRSTAQREYEHASIKESAEESICVSRMENCGGKQTSQSKKEIFDTEKLKKLHKSVRTRIYTMALERAGMDENITFSQLEAVDGLIFSKNPSAEADLPSGFRAVREYDKLVITGEAEADEKKDVWQLRQMSFSEYQAYKKEGRLHGAFSMDGIGGAEKLEVRTRRQGDKIDIGNGFKKLQDFFVDEKLPKHCRDKAEVLAMGNNILWVMPSELYARSVMKEKGRFSASFKVRKDYRGPIIILEKL